MKFLEAKLMIFSKAEIKGWVALVFKTKEIKRGLQKLIKLSIGGFKKKENIQAVIGNTI